MRNDILPQNPGPNKPGLVLATRKSPLALWQAEYIRHQLQSLHPGLEIQLLGLTTSADRLATPLYHAGGKGLFVRELEEALLSGKADMAVHSLKDVPMQLPAGLITAAVPARENPRDALITKENRPLPPTARIGTVSLRRHSQLLARHPGFSVVPLRGNLQTRLDKLAQDDLDGIVLAVAGLLRLGLENRIHQVLSPEDMLPACGQGALAIECRSDDTAVRSLLTPLNHWPTVRAITAERTLCTQLGSGCLTPVAAFAEETDAGRLRLRGCVGSPDGQILLRADMTGDDPVELGTRVATALLRQGAADLLAPDILP